MARRRTKKRTHVGAHNGPSNGVSANTSASRGPKSMVIRIGAGEVGPSITQLVKDVRAMMEPNTASRLKERRSNRLRDYTAMAGPLGVSHLFLFSRSAIGNTNLRLAVTPRGPTMHFRVEKYSLCKDIIKAQRRPHAGGKEYLTPPLLVMNHFTSPPPNDDTQPAVPKHLESLATEIFQNLVPPISPQTTPLASIRRVLLLNRELPRVSAHSSAKASQSLPDAPFVLNLRHFAIMTKRTGLSRSLRRLDAAERMFKQRKKAKGGVPNLGKLEDVADYLLDPTAAAAASGGFTSGSESEVETDAEIEVTELAARKVLNKSQLATKRKNSAGIQQEQGHQGVKKRAVKLVELGPRMKLRLTKLEEGICGGKVLWHEYLEKTKEEIEKLESVWKARREEKERRKKLQRENVEKKKRSKHDSKEGGQGEEGQEDENEIMDEDEWDSDNLDEGRIGVDET